MKHYGFRFLLDAHLYMDASGIKFEELELSEYNYFIESMFVGVDGNGEEVIVKVSRNFNRDWVAELGVSYAE